MALKFKTLEMDEYFRGQYMHPELVTAAADFLHFSSTAQLPEPLVSDVNRTKEDNFKIYLARNIRWREMATTRQLQGLTHIEMAIAQSFVGKSDEWLEKEAKTHISWHCFGCALDFSGRPYDDEQARAVDDYFGDRYAHSDWEYKHHHMPGERPHFHLGRRDFKHRAAIEQAREGGKHA